MNLRKFAFLFLMLFAGFNYGQEARPMKLQIKFSSTSLFVKLNNYTYQYKYKLVTDSIFTSATTATASSMTVPKAGTYDIEIYPNGQPIQLIVGASSESSVRKNTEINIKQWGDFVWQANQKDTFLNLRYLTITAEDIPDFSKVTTMYNMFSGCSGLTTIPNINSWDVTKVETMWSMFKGCTSFNNPINWSTPSLTDTGQMFSGATSFNSPVTLTMDKVISVSNMFSGATKFNQKLNFNTVKSTTLTGFLQNATSYDQDLSDLKLSPSVSLITNFITGSGLSCVNVSKMFNAWANDQNGPKNVELRTLEKSYGPDGKKALEYLANKKNWTITAAVNSNYSSTCNDAGVWSEPVNLSTSDIKKSNLLLEYNLLFDIMVINYNKSADAKIINSNGQIVRTFKIQKGKTVQDIDGLSSGVYYLIVDDKVERFIRK